MMQLGVTRALSSGGRAVRQVRPRITRVTAWKVELPLKEGRYAWSDGKFVETFDSTIVRVDTNVGVSGFGETCPLGAAYLPSYSEGVRTGVQKVAPQILGVNPTQLAVVNRTMDMTLMGHPYAKASLDIACWDILGKITGLPVCELLGGRFGPSVALYRAISQDEPQKMAASVRKYREEGYTMFQLKVGGSPEEDIERIRSTAAELTTGNVLMADANTGWLPHDAMRVCSAVKDLDVYIEQPCVSYEENLCIRRHCTRPFILDESVDSIGRIINVINDRAADVINLKISRVGGLTNAKLIRDICVNSGIAINIEDSWGSDVATAAIAHLAHSTPEKFRLASTDFNSYVTKATADGSPQRVHGNMEASSKPGLGITLNMDILGEPEFTVTL